jgi:hypothetical protein
MRLTVHEAIADIAPDAWNALAGDDYPFLRHEFLLAAEQTGCVSEDAGWAPRHLTIQREGKLLGAMPLYQKEHSWGEFVFDWAWARAYEQAGLSYYPKLVSAWLGALNVRHCTCCFPSTTNCRCSVKRGCRCARTASFTGIIAITQISISFSGPSLHPSGKRPDVTGAASAKPGFFFDD